MISEDWLGSCGLVLNSGTVRLDTQEGFLVMGVGK